MQTLLRSIISTDLDRLSDRNFRLSQLCWARPVVISISVTLWLFAAEVQAQQSESLQSISDTPTNFWEKSKALGKTDSFNIRIAFRRAVRKEETGIPFRWNNINTKHHGEIVLLNFTKPLGSCVSFKHTYYLRNSSANLDGGTVCKNSQGIWNDIPIPAVFQSVGGVNHYSKQQVEEDEIVREVQELLNRLNYDPGPIDGIQGPRTRRAIEKYQYNLDLPVTGQVSTELVTMLKQSVAATPQSQPGSIEKYSNTETVNISSSQDTAQPTISVLPDIGEAEIASETKGASKQASVISHEADVVGAQGYVTSDKTDNAAVNQVVVLPIEGQPTEVQPTEKNTPVVSADKPQANSSNDQVKTGSTSITGVPRFNSAVNGISVFPWFYAILGVIFLGIVALFFSRLVFPKRDRSSALHGRSDQVKVGSQGAISGEPIMGSNQTLAPIRNNELFDGKQNEGGRVQSKVNERAKNEDMPQPATGRDTEEELFSKLRKGSSM
ncbi:MAG: peptidoglycan-binding domain-containing protein [Gammaproteobacteria bacterium]